MFGFISRNMLTGLITILPVFLTLYLLYWMAITAESVLVGLFAYVLPNALYLPGMGVVAGLLVLFLIGVLMHAYVVRVLFEKLENLISHMPIIKPIYNAFRDFFDYFKPKKDQDFEQVVSVQINGNMKVIGFITEHEMHKLPQGFNDDDNVLVYLPLSYMIGGYAVLVPKDSVTVVDMSMEEAMRFSLTAGMTGAGTKHNK
ncbi:DUF502 domain-containing protein [Thiomicrorhabdus arctica]|uniref:DUF502 domain-containing protein n=1 Tax=Thiomicrorhabdus arctica TaxID=131540 RepID=UPI0003740DFB|nr:DUF502 domain-containing protein [Thiomicrorhabdus arctica]